MPKIWLAPAKINLFLHIIDKRNDGYHNLQTIFQLLDFCDELTFSLRFDGKIKRISGNENIPAKQDLMVKSATILQKKIGTNLGVDIRINKKIPIGGGLGGGSSDAATTLIALNQLWQANLSQKQLLKIGLTLGSDVPVFIAGKSAWAEGRGEILTPMPQPLVYFLLVCPHKRILTEQIFSHKALTTTPPIGKMTPLAMLVNPHNDCLDSAVALESEILAALNYLQGTQNHLHKPQMSGAGCCVFVAFKHEQDAALAKKNLPKKWSGFKAQALNVSPVYHWAVAKR